MGLDNTIEDQSGLPGAMTEARAEGESADLKKMQAATEAEQSEQTDAMPRAGSDSASSTTTKSVFLQSQLPTADAIAARVQGEATNESMQQLGEVIQARQAASLALEPTIPAGGASNYFGNDLLPAPTGLTERALSLTDQTANTTPRQITGSVTRTVSEVVDAILRKNNGSFPAFYSPTTIGTFKASDVYPQALRDLQRNTGDSFADQPNPALVQTLMDRAADSGRTQLVGLSTEKVVASSPWEWGYKVANMAGLAEASMLSAAAAWISKTGTPTFESASNPDLRFFSPVGPPKAESLPRLPWVTDQTYADAQARYGNMLLQIKDDANKNNVSLTHGWQESVRVASRSAAGDDPRAAMQYLYSDLIRKAYDTVAPSENGDPKYFVDHRWSPVGLSDSQAQFTNQYFSTYKPFLNTANTDYPLFVPDDIPPSARPGYPSPPQEVSIDQFIKMIQDNKYESFGKDIVEATGNFIGGRNGRELTMRRMAELDPGLAADVLYWAGSDEKLGKREAKDIGDTFGKSFVKDYKYRTTDDPNRLSIDDYGTSVNVSAYDKNVIKPLIEKSFESVGRDIKNVPFVNIPINGLVGADLRRFDGITRFIDRGRLGGFISDGNNAQVFSAASLDYLSRISEPKVSGGALEPTPSNKALGDYMRAFERSHTLTSNSLESVYRHNLEDGPEAIRKNVYNWMVRAGDDKAGNEKSMYDIWSRPGGYPGRIEEFLRLTDIAKGGPDALRAGEKIPTLLHDAIHTSNYQVRAEKTDFGGPNLPNGNTTTLDTRERNLISSVLTLSVKGDPSKDVQGRGETGLRNLQTFIERHIDVANAAHETGSRLNQTYLSEGAKFGWVPVVGSALNRFIKTPITFEDTPNAHGLVTILQKGLVESKGDNGDGPRVMRAVQSEVLRNIDDFFDDARTPTASPLTNGSAEKVKNLLQALGQAGWSADSSKSAYWEKVAQEKIDTTIDNLVDEGIKKLVGKRFGEIGQSVINQIIEQPVNDFKSDVKQGITAAFKDQEISNNKIAIQRYMMIMENAMDALAKEYITKIRSGKIVNGFTGDVATRTVENTVVQWKDKFVSVARKYKSAPGEVE
jgi:hypothetical protein